MVFHRREGDGRGRRAACRCATVLHRRRRDAQSGRLAQGRTDGDQSTQSSSVLRHHLVCSGGRLGADLRDLRPPPAEGARMTGAYASLEARFKRLGLVNEAVAMLNWDTAAMMPDGAAAARAEQLAELKVIAHEILADPRLADLMDDAGRDSLDDWQRANLAEMRRLWLHATAVPADLVAAYSRACSECEMAWRTARPANDFAAIQPRLQRVLDLTREVAAAKAAKLGMSPYEALLDQFEPGGRLAEIDRLFDHLAERLPALVEGALAAQAARKLPLRPTGPFPVEAQRQAGRQLMGRLGFEFDHGRLDQSLHPFCGGTPDDVRITTRYDEADFARALMGVLHETGHALYERGLPAAWRRQPVGNARGMALHESQSLLMEMQACRSDAFLAFAAPHMRAAFGKSGP